MKKLIACGALTLTSICVLPVWEAACNPTTTQQATNLIQPAAACVVDVVTAATGGPVDIGDIIAKCGVTVEDIIAIVSELLSSQPDAAAAADAALGVLPAEAHLRDVLQKAYEYKAAHK
ncbi:MAG TPA: hypothetical protein VMI75_22750 [Polyangiaceae bacterium]|nr:hypothetical protein [Polyangiaceae bacterium]